MLSDGSIRYQVSVKEKERVITVRKFLEMWHELGKTF